MSQTTVGAAVRNFQIQHLREAQMSFVKARSSGFPLPDDVALEIQAIMEKVTTIIARLEGQPVSVNTAPVSPSREMHGRVKP